MHEQHQLAVRYTSTPTVHHLGSSGLGLWSWRLPRDLVLKASSGSSLEGDSLGFSSQDAPGFCTAVSERDSSTRDQITTHETGTDVWEMPVSSEGGPGPCSVQG